MTHRGSSPSTTPPTGSAFHAAPSTGCSTPEQLGHSVRIRLDDIDHLIETATVDPDRDALPRWV